MRRLGAKDGRKVAHGKYLYILELLDSTFLPGEVDLAFDFLFTDDALGKPDEVLMKGRWRLRVRLHLLMIEDLHDKPPEGSVLNDRAMSRLSTLLHGACQNKEASIVENAMLKVRRDYNS